MRKFPLWVALACNVTAAFGAEHVVTQTGKTFSVKSMQAKLGDSVSFLNADPFVHNIFSLSDVQSFDLGTFAKGEQRKVTLGTAGRIEVECAVHPEMKLVIEVAK